MTRTSTTTPPTSVLRRNTSATPARPRPSHPTAILAIILAGYFMVILDNSIVITGLPHIEAELGLSAGAVAWVQNAYLLTFGGLLLLGARAGDILGRRRTFVLGLVIFTLASVVVGAAPTGGWLIAARAVQGIGSAVLAPSTLALLTATFPKVPNVSAPPPHTAPLRESGPASVSWPGGCWPISFRGVPDS
ncbi:MFS transporter [Rhodococcus sp. CX]|uniref:MFS transporter n=1 Tax=Rhodococcus sp. CX TaxID=2789880 RepID=UPI0027DD1198|nr:MFS transporter [Rhodococcus sp. CX]